MEWLEKRRFLELLVSAFDYRDLQYLEQLACDQKNKLIRQDIAHGKLTKPSLFELELARAGQKVQAIKAFRNRTGHGLLESKCAIEACMYDYHGNYE